MKLSARLERAYVRRELRAAKLFSAMLRSLYAKAAKAYEADQVAEVDRDLILKALHSFHLKAQSAAAVWQYRVLETDREVKSLRTGSYERIMAAIRAWVILNTGESITSIAATTLKIIRNIIAKGQNEGLGPAEVGRLIREEADAPFTKYRATMIARTEGTSAASEGHKAGAQEWEKVTGKKKWKAWFATADSRTRDPHRAMLGSKPIPGDQYFDVGGEAMEAPGDIKASAKNVINCRCRVVYMSERMAARLLAEQK